MSHEQFLHSLASAYRRQARYRESIGNSEGARTDLATSDRLRRIASLIEAMGADTMEEERAA